MSIWKALLVVGLLAATFWRVALIVGGANTPDNWLSAGISFAFALGIIATSSQVGGR